MGKTISEKLRELALLPSCLCLVAPLVGVSWAMLLGKCAGGSVSPPLLIALFSAIWIIYLGDRLYDVRPSAPSPRKSLRHRFAAKHRNLLGLLAFSALAMGAATIPFINGSQWGNIVAIGAAVGVYFAIFRISKRLHFIRALPLKEISISACFTAGIFLAAGIGFEVRQIGLFATLTAIFLSNCLVISLAEQEEDQESDPVAFFSQPGKWPQRVLGAIFFLCWLLLIGCVMGNPQLDPHPKRIIGFACALSLGGLVLIHAKLESSKPNTQALADAVLLSPFLMLGISRILESLEIAP